MKATLTTLSLVCVLLCASHAQAQRPEIVTQSGHAYQVLSAAFSPDGRVVATGDMMGTIKFWDAQTGRLLRSTLAHKGRVTRLVFSAGGDALASESKAGSSNAELYADESVRLWNVRTGKMLVELNLTPFAFSPDGKIFAAGDGLKINLWDASDARLLRTLAGHGYPAGTLAFTPDGKLLGSSGDSLADMPADEVEAKTDDGKDAAASKPAQKVDAGAVSDGAWLWDVATGKPVLELKGCADVHFNADATLVADSAGSVCETKTGALLHKSDGEFVAFSPDGTALALWTHRGAGSLASTPTALEVVNARDGKQLQVFNGLNTADIVAFSSDGQWLAFSTWGDGEKAVARLEVWDARQWRQAYVLKDQSFGSFSPDGKLFTAERRVSEKEVVTTLVEARKGTPLATLAKYEYDAEPTLFSPDGRAILTRNAETLRLLDLPGAKPRHVFQGSGEGTTALVFSPNGRAFAISRLTENRNDTRYDVWDTRSGALAHSYSSLASPETDSGTKYYDARAVAFSADGQLVKSGDGQVRDVRSGTLARRFEGASALGDKTYAVVDGQRIELRDAASGALIRRIAAPEAFTAAFSPDGKMLAVGFGLSAEGARLKLYDAQTGKLAHAFEEVEDLVRDVTFSPDSRLVAATIGSGSAGFVDNVVFDTRSGETLTTFRDDPDKKKEGGPQAAQGEEEGLDDYEGLTAGFLAFSPDNKTAVLQGREDGTVEIRDARTGKLVKVISGVVPNAMQASFSPDGKILVTADGDNALRFWRAESGELLATALSLASGDWLALTPDGLFDGSPAAWSKILWRFSEDTFNVAPAEIFFSEFYTPGLLGEIFAGNRPRASQSIAEKDRRQPRVAIELADGLAVPGASRMVALRLTVAEGAPDAAHAQGSGARDVRLFRNGSLVKAWRGDVLEGKSGATLEVTVPVVAGENRLTAYAFNRDNVKSVDSTLIVNGADSLKRKGTSYVLAVGVNEYANAQYNLRYAVADAQVFSDEWRRQQEQLKRYERVETVLLFDHEATKANMLAALAKIADKTQPEDAVVVYFAGHGTAYREQFYLLPHDLGYAGARTEVDKAAIETILAHSVSDRELEQAFEKINAAQILFVIDACNSGQALEAEEKRRGPMNSKGLAQLAYEKGMYVLTASQSFEAAQEAAQVGHGLLTYALVEEGLKKSEADTEPKDGEVRVREWLDYATRRVPEMQIKEMQRALARGIKLSFADEERALNIANRSGQRPRVFYRRELESQPLVVARPAAAPARPKAAPGQRNAPAKASPKPRVKRGRR
ncbi:MAG TPA: caspase family protein [Pyrinomonadaceae bacterium]|nr:caspase family protein [Pyrinomonadaceae bacterium]